MLRWLRSLLVLTLLPVVASAQPTAPAFQDGDVVGLIGDSITHGRNWHRYLYSYVVTRYPERKVRFVNLGIAGDSAGGAVKRLDWDILLNGLNRALIFLGMNDIGRGYYGKDNPDETTLQARNNALAAYGTNMEQLAAKLIAAGVKSLVFCTPSPYDDTAQLASQNFFGCNAALAECGRMGRELAAKYGGGVVDLNGPMTALNLERQKTDPAFTIVGPDRVHPGNVGMFVVAYLILKAQGAPALVSRVAVEGARVKECVNAEVTGLQATAQGLEFDYLEKALPWPVDPSTKDAWALVPAEADLNQQQFVVSGLPAGTYVLAIDGQEVGQYSAEDLARGVNLAMNDKAPQVKQAQQVWAVLQERANLEVRLRTHAQMQTVLARDKVNPDDPAAVDACFEAFLAKLGADYKPYYTNQANVFKQVHGEREQIRQKMDELQQRLWQLNQPVKHHYSLSRKVG